MQASRCLGAPGVDGRLSSLITSASAQGASRPGHAGRGTRELLYEGSHPSVWWAPNSKSTLSSQGVRGKDVSLHP